MKFSGFSQISKITRSLTEPPDGLPEPLRRRAGLLAWLQLTLMLLAGSALAVTYMVSPPGGPRRYEYMLLITVMILVVGLAYLFNRRRHYTISTWITVLAAFIGPWGAILVDPLVLKGDFIPLSYVGLSVLLCSLLLPARPTAVLSAIQLVLFGLLQYARPDLHNLNWPSLLTFIFFLAAISILVSVINQNDRRRIDEQTRQLAISAGQLESIMDNSTAIIYLKDLQGRYLLVNQQFEKIFGRPRAEVIGRYPADILPAKLVEANRLNDAAVLREGHHSEVEETLDTPDGPLSYISSKFPLLDDAGRMYALCNISTDITLQKKTEEALWQQSVRDPLTGLFNRRYMEEALNREIRRVTRSGRPIGLIMLDVDHFKEVNDRFGHAAGDAVLRALAGYFLEHIRGGDIACRFGGEEFVLILPEANAAESLARARQLVRHVKNMRVTHDVRTLDSISLSAGVAVFPDHGLTGDALLLCADEALYQSKSDGRNRATLAHSHSMPALTRE